MIWEEIKELNAATAALNASIGDQGYVQPWSYCGDGNIHHGGTASQVDRNGGYATIVECTDLDSAIGQAGCVLIEKGTVILTGGLSKRRHLRSALESFGWKASDLLQFDRAQRANEMARALWTYGMRDIDSTTVIRFEEGAADDDPVMGRGYMEIDETVTGAAALIPRFMDELS